MAPIVSKDYKEQKKQEILEGALICFAKKGFESATVDDICAQSGISKGAIYNYFKSKDEIYLELISQKTEDAFNKIKNALNDFDSSREKMDYLFSIYDISFPYEEAYLGEITVSLEFKLRSSRYEDINDVLIKRRHKYFVGLMAKVIEEGQKSGEFTKNNTPETYADLFWTMMDGLLIQSVYKDYPYHEVLKEMKAMFYQRLMA
jgi:AcrR family transcriptional regulator